MMRFGLHHLFFATTHPDRARSELPDLDFTWGRPHPGQGTANTCVDFANAYFELLFPDPDVALDAELAQPLGLHARASSPDASPVGIALVAPPSLPDPRDWPFETWSYAPPYLPEGVAIHVVTPMGRVTDPMVFVLSGAGPRQSSSPRELTGVTVLRPPRAPALSDAVARLARDRSSQAFDVEVGERHGLRLAFATHPAITIAR